MRSDPQELMGRVAMEAFETMGFLLPDPHAPEPDGRPLRGVRVAYRGPAEGAITVRADATVLEALAMNMTGSDEAPDLALQLDALGEIANVICGNVVPELEDPSSVFRLSAPVPVERRSDASPERTVRLGLEGGLVVVELGGGAE